MITIQPGCKVILKEQFVDSLYSKRGIVVNCSKDGLTSVNPKETVHVLLEDGNKVDGPAVEDSNGDKEYYLNGTEYSFKVWNKLRKMLWVL